jgi:hypothetical protein
MTPARIVPPGGGSLALAEILWKSARAETGESLGRLGAGPADAELVALVRDWLAAEPAGWSRNARAVAGIAPRMPCVPPIEVPSGGPTVTATRAPSGGDGVGGVS